ncbi:YheT family hydrolase [Salinimicrobium oceani]|uniref:Alpha/beta fold hydrolase n=1 Tax=Salinimicrobium oceani TaxID=2722702 RepID=A0ABX1CX59_9FLAO|nr:alpha/beta fold hydrolase [Salinimicrobium oceani]NJW52866.1 alpha/beta fold hydrolase [Salinimicrobium oceani]
MPIIKSKYQPSFLFRNYHVSTVYSATIRRISLPQQRERVDLSDGDFLDIDWSFSPEPATKVLLIVHGLEGSAKRPYVLGLAKYFVQNGWDVAAMNLRGCSGELNRRFRSYHAGATGDLQEIVEHILKKQKYKHVCFNGFSLGGNLMLKYLGENREVPKEISAAVMVSVPCDLHGSLKQLQKKENFIYARRFLYKLQDHLRQRACEFPDELSQEEVAACDSLLDIDDLYTSRAHDFENALDYYNKNSSLQFLKKIKVPTLLINAKNDGFLSPQCYPVDTAGINPNLFLEMPDYGGHVGFIQQQEFTYNEERAMEFIGKQLE